MEMGYGVDDWEFESQQGLGIFLFTNVSRQALGSIQLQYTMGNRGSFAGGKAAGA
jgi:hypothetical protein